MPWVALRKDVEDMFSALEIATVDETKDPSDTQGRQRMFGYQVHRHLTTTKTPASAEELERRRREYRREHRDARPPGRPIGSKGAPKAEKEDALRLLAMGLSLRDVAKKLGVSHTTVLRWKEAA
jgi:DNA invertase Pin-like site-specific DNA recombinase